MVRNTTRKNTKVQFSYVTLRNAIPTFHTIHYTCILNKNRNFTLFIYKLNQFNAHSLLYKVCVYEGHTSDKTNMQKKIILDQAFMNNVE